MYFNPWVDGYVRLLSHWDRVDSASACMAFGNTVHTVHIGLQISRYVFANDEYEYFSISYSTSLHFNNLYSSSLKE